jgi:hypothetical protein
LLIINRIEIFNIVARLSFRQLGNSASFPGRGRGFSPLEKNPTDCVLYTPSYIMDFEGLSPGIKRQMPIADHFLVSSAEIKKTWS